MTNVSLQVKDETGKIVSFDLPSISVLGLTKKIPLSKFKGVPSVLGIDFLMQREFYLHFIQTRMRHFSLARRDEA